MFGAIFLHIAVGTLVLTLCMALAFMLAIGGTLALVLTSSLALTFVLAVSMTLAFMLTFSMLALVLAGSLALTFVFAVCALAFVLTVSMTLAFMFSLSMLALVLTSSLSLAFMLAIGGTLALVLACGLALAFVLGITMSLTFVFALFGGMAAGTTVLATCGQFLAGCGISLHGISIITHFADFFAQNVGVCLFGIVIDRNFRRIGIVRVIFHTLEERNILFETIRAFLAFEGSVGLDGNALHLCVCTQGYYGHQGHQNKFFHFYCFINY